MLGSTDTSGAEGVDAVVVLGDGSCPASPVTAGDGSCSSCGGSPHRPRKRVSWGAVTEHVLPPPPGHTQRWGLLPDWPPMAPTVSGSWQSALPAGWSQWAIPTAITTVLLAAGVLAACTSRRGVRRAF